MVRCSFPDNSTIIGKDVEIEVGKCNEFQCFEAKMDYEMPIAQMKKLFALSGRCMQRIDFKCKLAPLKVNEILFRLILKCGVLNVISLIGCFYNLVQVQPIGENRRIFLADHPFKTSALVNIYFLRNKLYGS